ncbi:MAG: alpha/beta hydrolase [Gammaproteobacteria bacterium]|nr:alpha/beta hydrolase [Gammaproteobacteria bacterium]
MPSPEHEGIVAMLASAPIIESPDLATQRSGFEAMTAEFPLAAGTEVVRAQADGVPVEWITAGGADGRRTVLYLHGGGYVLGSAATHRSLASRLSAAAGVRVLVVDYRLAPEHPFPAAVEDALTAYRWALAQGLKAEQMAIAGDSAGGGLALALLVSIREAGLAMPACAVCLSPWVDLEGKGATTAPGVVDDPMVTLEGIQGMAAAYAAGQLNAPLASPLHADLAGLPPLLIQVGTREILLDDARRVAAKAQTAGVNVTLEEQAGLIHVWQMFPNVPESDQAVARIGAFLGRQLA